MTEPARGDIWYADLDPTRGHEQAGRRPVLIISVDRFNHGPADLLVAIPITSKSKGIPSHVRVEPSASGLRQESFILCEAIRSISKSRVTKRLGRIPPVALSQVEDILRVLLGLY